MKIPNPLLLAFLVGCIVALSHAAAAENKAEQALWIKKTTQKLQDRGAPSAELMHTLKPGQWAGHGYLLFSNGWASFACHTIHDSEEIGDVALLRTSDGAIYISHYHFCVGEGEFWFSHRAQPKNFSKFLELKIFSGQGWKRKTDP